MEQTVASLPPNSANPVEQLKAHGVRILANGRLSRQGEAVIEWLTLTHPQRREVEFWLLVETDLGWQGIFVDTTIAPAPPITLHTPVGYADSSQHSLLGANPVVYFSLDNDNVYALSRRQTDQRGYLTKLAGHAPLPNSTPGVPTTDLQAQAIDALLSGADPLTVVAQLLSIERLPDFEPNNEHTYFLGLAYELSGDAEDAVSAYLKAWNNCCLSFNSDIWVEPIADPFAIMAHARLEPVP